MTRTHPRGIAVIDIGATATKLVLFDAGLNIRAERRIASRHLPGPPYLHIDPEPAYGLLRQALPEFDAILPVDCVVPCAHGAALALLREDGSLALPVMDYLAEPPPDIVAGYRRIEPPFAEVFCPLLPKALTHAMQLYWQERVFPQDFADTVTIMPFIQYAAFRLGGARVSEISSISCQSQLVDVMAGGPSSLARARGWDRRFAPLAKAWDCVGTLDRDYCGNGLRGRGAVLAGVHDSNANYLRYLAGGIGAFTLLSSGTWIISFDPATPLESLNPARDTASNTDVMGRRVASSRFFGGREFEIIASGAPAEAADLATVARLVAQGTFALPSFTDSGGPLPGTGGKGRFTGPPVRTPAERSSLAALYCALMCDQQLDAVGSSSRIVVDGPFATNSVFLALLAALRPGQTVSASNLRDGTAAGAAVLGLMAPTGEIPKLDLVLHEVLPAMAQDLRQYKAEWRQLSR